MNIAHVVSGRSTCLRRHVGAILVKDKRIIATGYNGAPSGTQHCLDKGCAKENAPSGTNDDKCRGVHAELNCIAQAAKHGISVEGSTLYCTNNPCISCLKTLINCGVKEIVYDAFYPVNNKLYELLLSDSGLKFWRIYD